MKIERGPKLEILRLLDQLGETYGLNLVNSSGGKLRRGTIYVYLSRLVDDGLVSHREDPDSPSGNTRLLWSLTKQGRRVLAGTVAAQRAYRRAVAVVS